MDKRIKTVEVRVTKKEKEFVKKCAGKLGISVSEYMRACTLTSKIVR